MGGAILAHARPDSLHEEAFQMTLQQLHSTLAEPKVASIIWLPFSC
jgi:hypothetical protein